MKQRVLCVVARQDDDRLAGADDLAGLGTLRRHHTRDLGAKLGVAHTILRHPQLGFRGLDLRLGGLLLLHRLIELFARRAVAPQPAFVVLGLRQRRLRGTQFGFARTQPVLLVQRVEARQHLVGANLIAGGDQPFGQLSVDAESDLDLLARQDMAGQDDRLGDDARPDGGGADRAIRCGRRRRRIAAPAETEPARRPHRR